MRKVARVITVNCAHQDSIMISRLFLVRPVPVLDPREISGKIPSLRYDLPSHISLYSRCVIKPLSKAKGREEGMVDGTLLQTRASPRLTILKPFSPHLVKESQSYRILFILPAGDMILLHTPSPPPARHTHVPHTMGLGTKVIP